MEIDISGRHFHVLDVLRKYAVEKIGKLEKYASKLETAHVVMEVQKFVHTAEITLLGNKVRFVAKERSTDMYAAFDKAYESMKRQLRHHHEKIKDHKARRYET